MKRAILSGYYGYDNAGDEAILAATVEIFQQLAPDLQLTVLSHQPPRTTHEHGVRSINRFNLIDLSRELRRADLFLSGGGGLMQDTTSSRSVLYYSGLLQLAQRMKVPTVIYAQGIGPLKNAFSHYLVRHTFNHTTAITVRDPASSHDLKEIGVTRPIHVTADPVLALSPAPSDRVRAILATTGLDLQRPIIGVAIRPWKTWYERQLKCFSAVLAQKAAEFGAQILFLPFQPNHDGYLSYEAAHCVSCRPGGLSPSVALLQGRLTPREMMGIVGHLDLVIGMRLHALIMAAALHVPALGIVYDPKVKAFSEQAGYRYMPSVSSLQDIDTFDQLITEAWENRARSRDRLAHTIPGLRALSFRNAEIALEAIRSR